MYSRQTYQLSRLIISCSTSDVSAGMPKNSAATTPTPTKQQQSQLHPKTIPLNSVRMDPVDKGTSHRNHQIDDKMVTVDTSTSHLNQRNEDSVVGNKGGTPSPKRRSRLKLPPKRRSIHHCSSKPQRPNPSVVPAENNKMVRHQSTASIFIVDSIAPKSHKNRNDLAFSSSLTLIEIWKNLDPRTLFLCRFIPYHH